MQRGDHRYSRRRLGAFLDGELNRLGVERIALHLVDCPGCSDEVRSLLAIKGALQRAVAAPDH